jgi:hypothetical protein
MRERVQKTARFSCRQVRDYVSRSRDAGCSVLINGLISVNGGDD